MTRQVGERILACVAEQERIQATMETLLPDDEMTTLGLGSDKR